MVKKQEKTTVIIPDSHAEPGVCNRRFTAAGNFIADRQPTNVVHLGDHFDFPSLSSFDKGKKVFEGRRLELDLEVGIDGLEKLFFPIRKMKKKPRTVFTEGNHEWRYDRMLNETAALDGVLTKADLRLEEFYDLVVPYRKYVIVEGVTYTHHFTAGPMNKPIGGVCQARAISMKRPGLVGVQGHSHIWDIHSPVVNGKTNSILVAGCFFEQDMNYMDEFGNQDYWRGLTVLTHLENGGFDVEQYSMSRLVKNYL